MGLSRRERREQRKKVLKEQRLQQLKSIEEQEKHFARKKEYKGFLKFYEKHYLTLEIIPIVLMILAIIVIGHQVATTGDFMNKGVSLKGGMTITIPVNSSVSVTEIEKILKTTFPKDDIQVQSIAEFGVQQAFIISTDNMNEEQQYLTALSSLIPNVASHASVETTGSSLGGGFFNQTMLAMIIAFVCMSIVVFISFKDFWPSLMVISCALVDIIEPLAVINLLGIKVSTAGIAAFLMLIGYSVDTDILLTSRVLRGKEGTVFDRTVSAAKTGLLMTFSTLAAVTIGFFLTQSSTIKEIMTIMIIGLIFDIINTWIQNVALLRYHMEHIKGKKHAKPLPSQAAVDEEKLEDEATETFEQAEKEVEEEEASQNKTGKSHKEDK